VAGSQAEVVDEVERLLANAVRLAEGMLARRYFYPACHRMEPYRSEVPEGGWRLPVTERLTGRVMSLPTGTAVGPGEIGQVCEIVRFAGANGREIARRLAVSDRLVRPSQ